MTYKYDTTPGDQNRANIEAILPPSDIELVVSAQPMDDNVRKAVARARADGLNDADALEYKNALQRYYSMIARGGPYNDPAHPSQFDD